MMGVTHVFAGALAAMVLAESGSPGDCLAALIGGSLGGIICDIDLGESGGGLEAKRAGQLAGVIALAGLAADLILDAGILRSIQSKSGLELEAGVFCLLMMCVWGRHQPHRGGTHSLLAVILFSACVEVISGMLGRPFLIGMMSHLALDIFNRRPLPLLYPLRGGVCLGLCRADGLADRCLQTTAVLGTMLVLGVSIGKFL